MVLAIISAYAFQEPVFSLASSDLRHIATGRHAAITAHHPASRTRHRPLPAAGAPGRRGARAPRDGPRPAARMEAAITFQAAEGSATPA